MIRISAKQTVGKLHFDVIIHINELQNCFENVEKIDPGFGVP